jgi:serine/threonine protein kinase
MKPVKTSRFGRYVLLRRIAVGGMAEIYRAIAFGSEGFRKPVAIKRLLPFLSENSEYVEMFIREARLAAMLNHANIVQLYDFGRIEGRLYISMEYVHGKDLAELIDRVREESYTVPAELACHLLIQVLEGLRYAHTTHSDTVGKAGLIHRDVTPPNIMISFSGEVKIADFGIAKFPREKTSEGTTLKGKLSYMSPEQAQGLPLDHRSDLFSLAICVIELMTLKHVFDGRNDFDVLNRIREVKFTPPREINPAIPEQLEAILLKALERDPEDRYQNADEFYAAVESFMIEMNYRYSASWLANYMRDLFKEDLEVEREELRAEGELADSLRSEGDAGDPGSEEQGSLDADPYEDIPTQTLGVLRDKGATYDELVKSLYGDDSADEETDFDSATVPVMQEQPMRPGEQTFGDITAVRKPDNAKDQPEEPEDIGEDLKTIPVSERPEFALEAESPEPPVNDEMLTVPLGAKPELPPHPSEEEPPLEATHIESRARRGFFRRHWFLFLFIIMSGALVALLMYLNRQERNEAADDPSSPAESDTSQASIAPLDLTPEDAKPEPGDAGIAKEDAGTPAVDGDAGPDGATDGGDRKVDAGPKKKKKKLVKKGKKKRYTRKKRKRRRRKKTRKRKRRKKRTKTRRKTTKKVKKSS